MCRWTVEAVAPGPKSDWLLRRFHDWDPEVFHQNRMAGDYVYRLAEGTRTIGAAVVYSNALRQNPCRDLGGYTGPGDRLDSIGILRHYRRMRSLKLTPLGAGEFFVRELLRSHPRLYACSLWDARPFWEALSPAMQRIPGEDEEFFASDPFISTIVEHRRQTAAANIIG